MVDFKGNSFDLRNNYDVVMARQRARELAHSLGFGLTDQTRIATAVSEVARRALENQGSISFAIVERSGGRGIECICLGCVWMEREAPREPGDLLGGLRTIERLMDDFELQSSEGQQTVVMRKWLRANLSIQSAP